MTARTTSTARRSATNTFPLTAKACVVRVYTELAVIDVTPKGFVVIDMVPGMTIEALQKRTDAPLHRE